MQAVVQEANFSKFELTLCTNHPTRSYENRIAIMPTHTVDLHMMSRASETKGAPYDHFLGHCIKTNLLTNR